MRRRRRRKRRRRGRKKKKMCFFNNPKTITLTKVNRKCNTDEHKLRRKLDN